MLVKHSVAAYDLCHADPTYVSLLDARPLTCQNAWQSLSRQVNQVVEGDSITQTSPPATIAADSGSTGVMTGALAYKFGSLSTTSHPSSISSQLLYSFTAWHPSRLQEAKSRCELWGERDLFRVAAADGGGRGLRDRGVVANRSASGERLGVSRAAVEGQAS